jgi:hypothetical protein
LLTLGLGGAADFEDDDDDDDVDDDDDDGTEAGVGLLLAEGLVGLAGDGVGLLSSQSSA